MSSEKIITFVTISTNDIGYGKKNNTEQYC